MDEEKRNLGIRDGTRILIPPKRLKGRTVLRSDVGKIFVLITGKTSPRKFSKIFTQKEFLELAVDRLVLWYEITNHDINTIKHSNQQP